VLGRPTVGVTQNFFDLGGTSLDLVSVAQRLPGPPRVVDVFRYPTVRALAGFLDGTATSTRLDLAVQRGAARRARYRNARRTKEVDHDQS